MEIAEAFRGDVSPETFFLERLPALHDHHLELFARYSEATLRFCIHLTDVQRRFSVELGPEGSRAIEGEFIDFPVLTLEGRRADWGLVREVAAGLFEKGACALRERPPDNRITREFLDDFEHYDGNLEVLVGFEQRTSPVEMRLVLNDYAPVRDAPELQVELSVELLTAVLEGRIEAEEAREAVELSKNVGFAFELSGLLLNHFPELESD